MVKQQTSRFGRRLKQTPKAAAAADANKQRLTKRMKNKKMKNDINSLGQRLKGLSVKPSPTPHPYLKQSVSNAQLNNLKRLFACNFKK